MKTSHLVIICVACALFAALVGTRLFVFDLYSMPSESMYPTIPEGSLLVVNKLGYAHMRKWGVDNDRTTARVARGDIVVFLIPDDDNTTYVKRVVAIPGDHIEYRDRHMTLNGTDVPLELESAARPDGRWLATEGSGAKIHIAFYFERATRDFDLVVPDGEYVMFGDNRDNSRDSRYIGTIARDRIMGKLVRVLNFEWLTEDGRQQR
jgi:signal peptidase I